MPFYFYQWNAVNIRYLAQHDVSQDEFEEVVGNPEVSEESRSSGRFIALGTTAMGSSLCCVYEMLDDVTVYPFTAYEIER
ncbi:MAG: hypothetical protein AB7U20_04795 [Planctomycetaceae bacterium]